MIAEITTRQLEIIKAAGKILSEAGVTGLTIKNLAKEMKFSESAIYRHFKSKEDIIVAMLSYLAEDMDKRYTNALSEALTTEEKFVKLFTSQFTFFSKNTHFVAAVFSDGLMEQSQRINETITKLMAVKMKHLMPIIMEGQQKEIFTNAIATEEIIHIIMGTFRLQMYKWRTAHFQFDINRSGENMIFTLLTLLKTK